MEEITVTGIVKMDDANHNHKKKKKAKPDA